MPVPVLASHLLARVQEPAPAAARPRGVACSRRTHEDISNLTYEVSNLDNGKRLHPVRWQGMPLIPLRAKRARTEVSERRFIHADAAELSPHFEKKLPREAPPRADATRVAQRSIHVVKADKKGPETLSGCGEPPDHKRFRANAFRLEPLPTSAGQVDRASPFAHDALCTQRTGMSQNAGAGADEVRHVAEHSAIRCRCQELLEPRLAFVERPASDVDAVVVHDVEDVHDDAAARRQGAAMLERLKACLTARQQDRELAI